MTFETAAEPATTGPQGDNTPTTPKHRRRWPLVAAATAVAIGVSGGALAYGSAVKTVTLDVDGNTHTVRTTAGSVNGLLERQGVNVGARDTVTPGKSSELSENSDVVVRSGKELTLRVDGKQKDTWVNALDAGEALDSLTARGGDVDIVASRSGDRASLPVDLDLDAPVAVVADDKAKIVDGASDVADVLKQAAVNLDGDDRVHVTQASDADVKKDVVVAEKQADKQAEKKAEKKAAADTTADTTEAAYTAADTTAAPQVAVVVQRVKTEKVTKKVAVDHKTETRTSDDRYSDLDAKVAKAGKDGERTVVRSVTTVDGKVTKSEKISDKVTTKPVTGVLVEGTKERPEPKPEPEPEPEAASSSSSSSFSGSTREIGQQMAAARGWTGSEWTCLESLWDRESGWSASASNASSGAYGIPQSLPGSKMASAGSDWQSNPATQIEWGLGYIADVYGSPCGAWGHSESVGWY